MKKGLLLLLICAAAGFAHPMGNFSVNHYTRLRATAGGVDIEYVLDLAEIPTFELLRGWNLERTSPAGELDRRATEQAREWFKNLSIRVNGRTERAKFESARLTIADGAGNLPIVRIAMRGHVNGQGGELEYEDNNFPGRAGWKEIVIGAGNGAALRKASEPDKDLSKALTQYPPDPTIAPPQDLRAELAWTSTKPLVAGIQRTPQVPAPVVKRIPQPHSAPAATAPAAMTAKAAPPGAVIRGDFVSKLLHQRQLTPWMIFLLLACAFGLGSAHALTPGHGKSIVAAYLVGSRGTLKHAVFLGAMVTFTHTISVFALGIATLFLFRYMVPEKITEALGVVSGLSIVAVGGWMLYKRISHRAGHAHTHDHHHHHDNGDSHDHHHPHQHGHDHAHPHDHHPHDHHHPHSHDHHHHGGHVHSHVPEQISWGSLVALGASGGLVPCESALILLLGAIALGRVGLGLLLLIAFSLGLALVLMAIGILVLYAKNLLPQHKKEGGLPVLHWLAIASPAVVMVVGMVMTGISLGWISPKWMIG